jgi:hypothetical protein
MKQLGTTLFLVACLFLAACGSSNNNSNLNGNWNASLTSQGSNSPTLAFTTTLDSTSSNAVSASNLNFTTNDGCFSKNNATANGTFTLSGNFNGNVNGAFGMTVQGPATGASGNNTLILTGTVANGNSISGTWTLAGLQSGCTGSGTFTMTKM